MLLLVGTGLALRTLTSTAGAQSGTATDCREIPGAGSLRYTAELLSHEADIWSYSLTVTEYNSVDCSGEGTVLSVEDGNATIRDILMGSCELGAHVEQTLPESEFRPIHRSGLTGWVFENVDFSFISVDMDADYPAGGFISFLVFPEALQSPSGGAWVPLQLDGPACSGVPTATAIVVPDVYEYSLGFRWTLIGWLGPDRIDVIDALDGDGDLLTDVTGVVTAVYGWDVQSQSWRAFFPDAVDVPGANNLEVLREGSGYWIAIDDPEGASWIAERRPR